MSKIKLLIVGLDAATLDLVNPWVGEGKLPNIAQLMKEGVSGRLASILPPITPPAWTSFMTGKNPGKHRIFHFMEAEPGSYSLRYVNASSRCAKTIWKMLSDAGFSVGTMNIPFTYPPEHLNGFQISGMDTPSEKSAFVYPPEIRDELEGLLGRFTLDVRYLGYMSTDRRREEVLAEMERIDQQWLQASLHLMEKHPAQVLMFTFMSVDTVQHYFWHYMDASHHYHDPVGAKRFGDAILRVYERLDRAVGEMLKKVSTDTSVLVVSDHGGGPTSDRVVYLNRFLAQQGLLHYLENNDSALKKLARGLIHRSYTLLRGALSSAQKRKLANALPKMRKRFETAFTSFTNIDWSRTKAYCSEVLASPPSIWINRKGIKPFGIVEESDYESLIKFITERIGELKDPRTNEPVIKRILRREEIFHGPYADQAADLILDWWEASHFSSSPSFPEQTTEPAVMIRERKPPEDSEWGGTHRLHGILIVRGPAFRKNVEIEGARLLDMAPTILHLLGQPVPDDMDGHVLEELFEPSFLAQNPVQRRSGDGSGWQQQVAYSAEESAIVEQRLKDLGYIQ